MIFPVVVTFIVRYSNKIVKFTLTQMSGKVHVCSLSMSCLTRINNVIHEIEGEDISHEDKLRLRWLQVAMSFNRQKQLQYIYAQCGSKGNDPKFRSIRMRSFMNQWKRQVIRDDLIEHLKILRHNHHMEQIKATKMQMIAQRSEISARKFPKTVMLDQMTLSSLFTPKESINRLNAFEAPTTCRPGYYNRGYQFLETTAVRTLSTAPTELTEESKWSK